MQINPRSPRKEPAPPLPVDHSDSTATIHLDRLGHNLEVLKEKSGRDRVMAVIKADAYGHGAVAIARYLEKRVEWFAVATIDEGILLRDSGIGTPILVFGAPREETAPLYRRYRLAATISCPDHFRLLLPGTQCHLRYDTGMRRSGFYPEQTEEVLRLMEEHPELICEGIYSHYATADEEDSDFVGHQNTLFRQIRSRFSPEITAHMSNSAAVLHYNVEHFDMIRVGIGLHGYSSGLIPAEGLRPVLEWQTSLHQIRRVRKGEGVSYNLTWRAPHDGYLATLPVGYADGVPRSLSNRLRVVAAGKKVPVVGNITMDCCMIFLGEEPLPEGTTVQLMGGEAWPANRWATEAGTNTHELLCRLTQRVRRLYL